ncbi:MAG: hypothetical protein HZA19_02240, partial [Nitrospirae bacterium]|nr:hypothetical protein [Nitrospirota bacterium]
MRSNRLKVWSPFFVFLLLSGIFLLAPAFSAQAETLKTDQPEYAIGDFATITGQGFVAGVTVTIEVQRVDNVVDRTEVTVQTDGTFQYVYYLNPNLPDPDAAFRGTLTVRALVNNAVVASTTFLDNPLWTLQGCSKGHDDCVEKSSGSDWAKNGSQMDGWTSGELQGWYEGENVPYRLR